LVGAAVELSAIAGNVGAVPSAPTPLNAAHNSQA